MVAMWVTHNAALHLGSFSGLLLGLVIFTLLLFGFDRFWEKHPLDGFQIRSRADYLFFVCSAVPLLLVFEMFSFGYWQIALGCGAGIALGMWLENYLGWEGVGTSQEAAYRYGCLATLLAISNADGNSTPKENQVLHDSGRELLASFGLKRNEDIQQWVSQASTFYDHFDMPQFHAQLPPEWKLTFLMHALRMTYCSRPVSARKKEFMLTVYGWMGVEENELLAQYDRNAAASPEQRKNWFEDLEIHPGASLDEIQSAYREIARKYHPDRLQDLPPDIVKLASSRLAKANAAYKGLTNKNGKGARLAFRAEQSDTAVYPQENERFRCRCWVCERKNQIASEADPEDCRCGHCHALLGTLEG